MKVEETFSGAASKQWLVPAKQTEVTLLVLELFVKCTD
jgi:hypothetical protein